MNQDKNFPHRHILAASDLSREDIEIIFSKAEFFLEYFSSSKEKFSDLKNKTVVLAFFENSTRTKNSFELAAQRLSADVLSFSASGSSLSKGESLFDTLQTIEAMDVDMIVVRHSASGAAKFLADHGRSIILNAGDGQHEHPTQALLDAFTLKQKFSSLEGKKICIVGDVLHSRVARSNISLLTTLGAEVGICGPNTLLPKNIEEIFPVRNFSSLSDATDWADALNVLRLQRERQESGLLPSLGEYAKYYGVNKKILDMKPELTILHPGPVNYGVEISYDVANSPQSLIRTQVRNGVFIRMALLSLLSQN